MPGLRGGDCERDRLEIAHLAYHDYVRIFPERSPQGRAERTRVGLDLPLCDVATVRFEDVFNRIFQGDYMLVSLEINLLDQRRERCRFSAPNRAGDKDEPVLIAGQ